MITLGIIFFSIPGLSMISSSLIFLISGLGCSATVMRVLSESGRASIAVFSVGLKTLEKAGTLPGGVFFMANLILLKRFSNNGRSVKKASKIEKMDCTVTIF